MPEPRSKYLEIRVGDPIPEGSGGIRIGSESCSQLLPSAGEMKGLSRRRDPASLSLVTPVAGPDEVMGVLKSVKSAAALGWGEIVVNDWGVLNEAQGVTGGKVTAGRLLMRFRRGPGFFDPWEELDAASRRYFAWGPLYDSPFLAFLKAKGIDRIELDPPRHWLALPDTDGFSFSFHRDTRLISVSAACPWLYDENKGDWRPVTGCGRPCLAKEDIVMTTEALKEPLLLRGRAVLERVKLDLDGLKLPDTVDRVISDHLP